MLFVSMSFKPACKVFTEKCFISYSVITINENLPDRSEETVELATRAANIGNALVPLGGCLFATTDLLWSKVRYCT